MSEVSILERRESYEGGMRKLEFKRILLYTACILFHIEWCIRWLRSSIISYYITNIPHKHHTNNNNPFLNTKHVI